jgi:hypothetical protein
MGVGAIDIKNFILSAVEGGRIFSVRQKSTAQRPAVKKVIIPDVWMLNIYGGAQAFGVPGNVVCKNDGPEGDGTI